MAATYVLVLTPVRELAVQVRRMLVASLLGGCTRCRLVLPNAVLHCGSSHRLSLAYHARKLHLSSPWQVHSMIQRLAQFTDIQAALVVGGLSLQAQATTLRAQPEIVVATPVRAPSRGVGEALLPAAASAQHLSITHNCTACRLPCCLCPTCMPAFGLCACCQAAPTPRLGRRQRSGARSNKPRLFRLPLLLTSAPLCSTCAHPSVYTPATLLCSSQ